jgi:hypothetical protein
MISELAGHTFPYDSDDCIDGGPNSYPPECETCKRTSMTPEQYEEWKVKTFGRSQRSGCNPNMVNVDQWKPMPESHRVKPMMELTDEDDSDDDPFEGCFKDEVSTQKSKEIFLPKMDVPKSNLKFMNHCLDKLNVSFDKLQTAFRNCKSHTQRVEFNVILEEIKMKLDFYNEYVRLVLNG